MEYREKSCILASVVLTSQGFNRCNITYDGHHIAMRVIVANKLSLSPPPNVGATGTVKSNLLLRRKKLEYSQVLRRFQEGGQ